MIVMEISQETLAYLYVCAFLLGIASGLLYDLLRITRVLLGVHYSRRAVQRLRAVRLPLLGCRKRRSESRALGLIVFLEDFLFCLIVGASMIVLFYSVNRGKIRLPAFAAAGFGFLFYRATLGRLMTVFAEVIAFAVEAAVSYCLLFITYPIKCVLAFLQKRRTVIGLRLRADRERRTRRRFTRWESQRTQTNACGLIPTDGHIRKLKGGKRLVKHTKKTIQSHAANARASRRAGGGGGGGVRQ